MRILWLGNSQDNEGWFEGGRRRHDIVSERLGEALGEPVEVVLRPIWPNEGATGAVEKWLRREQPDVVYITMVSYWFAYPSVPLRMRRLLGPFGSRVAGAGFRWADSPRWAHNAAFRAFRRLLQQTIGGDTHFTPEEVVERMKAILSVMLREEGVVIAVTGADGRTDYGFTRRGRRNIERKRLQVDEAMRTFCQDRSITYVNGARPLWETDRELGGNRVGDGLHANERWHSRAAELVYETIASALVAAGRMPEEPAGLPRLLPAD